MGKCKDCAYAHFEMDQETGATKWEGRCYASMILDNKMKYHTVMQHFNCSNNKFKKR